tara:strand:- start:2252 stop:2536 length:285 start_codon:yes stop_codon:yes gene_type:complete
MSVNINISSENNNCSFYANFLSRNKIKSKIYSSIFINNDKIYDGCTISLENKFNNQKILNSIIKKISKEIPISYIEIDGLLDGDIHYPYNHFVK